MNFFKSLLILLLLINLKSFAQTATPNIGFEDGTFNYWQCYTGTIDVNGNIMVSPTAPIYGLHTVISKSTPAVVDPYGLFPVFCPNGSNYSIKLNDNTSRAKAQRVTYTFTVPTNVSAYSIIFNYAVVLQNPGHLPYQQPAFIAQVYDITDGKYIDCPSFNFVAGTALPGFKLSANSPASAQIYYKDWSTATIDLKGYLGKNMRIEFTVNDCTKGGHFGYAYLDVEDNSTFTPITGNAYCLGQKSIDLYGPYGFDSYFWYNANLSKLIGTGQSLKISPPPPDGTEYALQVFPYPGLGCVDTLYTVINKINEGFNLSVKDTVHGCPGTGVDLTAPAITAGSSSGMTLSYFTDSLGTSYLYNPNMINSSGTYYIQGINKEGCENILPVYVTIGLPAITIIEPAAVDFPVTVDLTRTYVHVKGLTYTCYKDSSESIPVTNTTIKYSGTYYIKATDSTGCTTSSPVNIIIHPPPTYTVTGPNTFTPNRDGINDHFFLTITGIVTFKNLRIYNRDGQQVFSAKSISEFWDGNYNGKNLQSGAYYWVFEGEDDYNNVPVREGGYITLIR